MTESEHMQMQPQTLHRDHQSHALITQKDIKNLQQTQERKMKPTKDRYHRGHNNRPGKGILNRIEAHGRMMQKIIDPTEGKIQNLQLDTMKYLSTVTQGGLMTTIGSFF